MRKTAAKILSGVLTIFMLSSGSSVYAKTCGSTYAGRVQTAEVLVNTPTDAPDMTTETADTKEAAAETADAMQADTLDRVQEQAEAPAVTLNGIQTMDMGRYVIVGVDQTPSEQVMYRYQAYDFSTGAWTIVHDWTRETCIFWVPEHTGDYNLYVEAMTSSAVTSCAVLHHFSGCETTLGDISFNCGKTGFQYDVAYTTNDSELAFRWQAYDVSTGAWYLMRDWSGTSSGTWNAPHAGDYFLYVEAKGGDGDIYTQLYVCHADDPTITSFTLEMAAGYVNEDIMLDGTYADATGQVGSERYLAYDGTYWQEIPQSDGKGVWNTGTTGTYLLCYQIYDKQGDLMDQQAMAYEVRQTPYATIGGIETEHPSGLDYTFAANVETNDVAIQYRWQYYDIEGDAWYVISDWSENAETCWTAPKGGYYWITVEAKLHNGTVTSYTEGLTAYAVDPDKDAMCAAASGYSSSTGYLILVNCTTHKVGVFSGSQNNWTMNYYWDCADGKASTPTVTGTFTVGAKGSYFDSGSSRCYWYTQFYGNYLFHSVLYSKYDGSLVDGRVGMALSHGCVRLQIDNAKWIYDNIPTGTTVVVYRP